MLKMLPVDFACLERPRLCLVEPLLGLGQANGKPGPGFFDGGRVLEPKRVEPEVSTRTAAVVQTKFVAVFVKQEAFEPENVLLMLMETEVIYDMQES